MIPDCVKKKVEFVADMFKAYDENKVYPDISKIYYDAFELNYGDYAEFVVVEFTDGLKSVRNCKMNSIPAVEDAMKSCIRSYDQDHLDYYNSLKKYEVRA